MSSHAVDQAADALNNLAEKAIKVSLVWIPAHRSFFGNTLADDLAKEGARSRAPALTVLRSRACYKNDIEKLVYAKWTCEWQRSPSARQTKLFYIGPMKSQARYVYKLARLELGRFVRLVSGHNNLNYFQHRIGLHHSPLCRFCLETDETFFHLVTDCPRFHQTRVGIFLDETPTNTMRWSVRDLLDFSYTPAIDVAMIGTWAHGDPAGLNDLDSPDVSHMETTRTSDDDN